MRPPVDLERLASVNRKTRAARYFAADAFDELEALRTNPHGEAAVLALVRSRLETTIDAARDALAELAPLIDALEEPQP